MSLDIGFRFLYNEGMDIKYFAISVQEDKHRPLVLKVITLSLEQALSRIYFKRRKRNVHF